MDYTAQLAELSGLWFTPETEPLWFQSTPEFDRELKTRFEPLYLAARDGQLAHLNDNDDMALALVILLDQIPLNIYRRDGRRYATADQALAIAQQLIFRSADQALDDKRKLFLYMPFMHSERLTDQKTAIGLFEKAGMTDAAHYARHHHDIVERFGRFPHRNAHLGRESTREELAWLASDEAFSA